MMHNALSVGKKTSNFHPPLGISSPCRNRTQPRTSVSLPREKQQMIADVKILHLQLLCHIIVPATLEYKRSAAAAAADVTRMIIVCVYVCVYVC